MSVISNCFLGDRFRYQQIVWIPTFQVHKRKIAKHNQELDVLEVD
ncbi:hypothetical protein [Pleurocapsa sp. CCALA 161]|nr:hypothetical protein [Pleurocapsa sp. CCALA 161]